MSHYRAVLADVAVELPEHVAVTLNGEVGNPPHTFAQNVDDCADVEELHPTPCGAQLPDPQPRRPRRRSLALRRHR